MARIVIASASETGRERMQHLLATSGFSVFRCCTSGSDIRRTMNECDDGIVILIGSLPDCEPDELQWDYGERIQILLIARRDVLDSCEAQEIFRLAMPASSQAVVGAVEMLSQLHQMRLPRRMGSARQIVEEAKQLLMREQHLTEPEAHRFLQQYAMNHGLKMADYAAQIIRTSKRTEA